MTNENEHKRRAKVLATTLRAAGKHYQAIADQLNAADFKTIAMYFSDQLAAIGRIAVAIKAFRQHTGYTGRLVESPALNTYLADRLLPTDFNLWTSLSLTERIN